jgi:carbon starvation protein
MLAFATFVYDTLDVATRLGRYLLEELFSLKGLGGRWLATLGTLFVPGVYVLMAPTLSVGGKPVPLWNSIWPLFGSSNQLLAALTLLLMSVWAKQMKKRAPWLIIPTAFMFLTSTTALVIQMKKAVAQLSLGVSTPSLLNLTISTLLLVVSFSFLITCLSAFRKPREALLT